jgi:tetratricopeptide (TPR) repeat protein
MGNTKLHAVRKSLGPGWSQAHVVRQLQRRAAARNLPIASGPSLAVMLSRWENGHVQVTDPMYQSLFREVYGRSNAELGFPPAPLDDSTAELHERLRRGLSVDESTVDLLRRQIDEARQLDRRLGAVPLLEQLNATIEQVDRLLHCCMTPSRRAALAAVLADAATLAGWQALDRGSLSLAWRHHEIAKAAAQEAGSPSLLVYGTGQQAFILLDLGMHVEALQLLDHAQTSGNHQTADLLAAWVWAARGELLAANGDRTAALRSFDRADAILPSDPHDPELPFLMLNPAHLTRWRGHALRLLGDRGATSELEAVLDTLHPATARARAGILVDLAFGYADAADRDRAITYLREARQLAAWIGSERLKRELARLLLPPGAREQVQQDRDDRPRAE